MRTKFLLLALAAFQPAYSLVVSQTSPSEHVEISPPIRRAEAPSPSATVAELEKRGDILRAEKEYLDATDFYRAAIARSPNSAQLRNKLGISFLQMQRFKEARKEFDRAIKLDRAYADAYNNRGVVEYIGRKYGKAIHEYEKALTLKPDTASYYGNLGAAYFTKKEWEKASDAYNRAVQIDPDIFERNSRVGVAGQISSPDDRAHFQYVLAKLYAKHGLNDRSLQCLRKAMEEGYKGIEDVYKDTEFTELRKDPRFAQLMETRPAPIAQ